MAYGKFAPKLKINNNPYYGNSWDAIGYAIGNALGNLWGANYNQRGIEKGEAEAQEALQKAYNKVYGNTQPAPESLQTQYEDVTGKMGIPQGQQGVPQSKDAATYIDTTQKYLGNNSKADTTGKTMKDMTPQRDIKAEKFDTFMSKYNSGTPNPDGDAQKVDALTQAANGNLANMDFSKLPSMSAEDLQSAIRKELRANGRTDYQINKVLENLSPAIKAKVQEGNNVNFGNLYERLNQQIRNGELDAANMTFAKMAELNPKMAAALQPKMKRAWDANALEQNFQTKFDFYRKDPNLTEREAYNLARYGSVYTPAEQAKFVGISGRGNRATGGWTGGGSTNKKNASAKQNDAKAKLYKEIIADREAKGENSLYSKEDYNDAKNGLKILTRQNLADVHVTTDDDIKNVLRQTKYDKNMSNADLINVVKGMKGMDSDRIRGIVQWIENEWPENEGVGFFKSLEQNGYTSEPSTKETPETPARYDNSQIGNRRIGEWFNEWYTNDIAIPWELAKQKAIKNKNG